MNPFFRQLTAGISLAASVSLTGCQDKTLLSPDHLANTPNAAQARVAAVGATLIRHGQATLTYQSDGRLQRATYAPGPVVYPADNVYYTYGPGLITAKSYRGTTLVGVINFLIDPNLRCIESRHVWYGNSRTGVESAWTYTYNTLGQLAARADKNSRFKINYSYSVGGDLSRAAMIDGTGAATDIIDFTYSLHNPPADHNPPDDCPTDTPLLDDRSPLNADFSNLFYGIPPDPYQPSLVPPDPYLPNAIIPCIHLPDVVPPDPCLPIFGTPSKHLVQQLTLTDFITGQVEYKSFFTYVFNTTGYVTQAREFSGATNALVATRLYGYLLPAVLVAK